MMAGLLVVSCTKDEIDVEALTDFAPGIVTITPGNNSKIVVGNFDLKVVVADGESSPLSEISVQLTDEFGNTLADATQSVTGTLDSIVIAGADFAVPAEQLGAGIYGMNITVTDAKGQTTNRTTSFEISLLPFAANHDAMWIAGGFNGWGADEMTLVSDHTWEITGIDLLGDEWKFKNCFDWCDEDWGDTDCNGFMESNQDPAGNGNTGCGFAGEVIVTFNDATLEYTVRPAVEFATNLSGLYLLGTFNNFDGNEYPFQLVSDNTWELAEVELAEGDEFKFAEMPNFMGKNFGDADGDGVAEEFGNNTTLSGDPGLYKITFNDATLEYTMEFLGSGTGGGYESIGIIGNATPGGWDADTDMTDNGDGTYSILVGLLDGFVKFRADDDWAVNWGSGDFPTGTGTQNGADIPVTFGLYQVTLNVETGEYSFEAASVGIIGDSTPGGWDMDTDMTPDPSEPSVQTINVQLTDGFAKFRLNDDWGVNWGSGDFPSGAGTQNGADIPVTAGTYDVRLNVLTGEYSFE